MGAIPREFRYPPASCLPMQFRRQGCVRLQAGRRGWCWATLPVIWSPIFLPPPPLASLLPPPSCAGGIRHAITVPNAGGRERLFLVDPSPAATRRNRRSPGRASHVGGRGCSARLTCVGRLQAGESCPLGPVCSVTYAARLPASWAPGLYLHHASHRVMARVLPRASSPVHVRRTRCPHVSL